MDDEELRQHKIAWVPWILAIIALLGVDIFSKDNSNLRSNNDADGPCLSVFSKDLGIAGRVSDPLVNGPPSPPAETIACHPGVKFLKLETDSDFHPTSVRHRVMFGRALPFEA